MGNNQQIPFAKNANWENTFYVFKNIFYYPIVLCNDGCKDQSS